MREGEGGASGAGQTTLYAEFTARPGAEATVLELILAYAEVVRAEPGNLEFQVYRRQEAPARFVVFEIYADDAAFQAHLAHPAGQAFNDRLTPLIEEAQSELSFLRSTGR